MDPKHPNFDRPNTLGQAWRKMNDPRVRKVADLPPLPDWPPLPEDRFRVDWPELSPEPVTPVAPNGLDETHQTESDATAQPRHMFEALRIETGVLGRWRRASKRMRWGIAAAAFVSALLIVACSSLALHVAAGIGGSATAPMYGNATSQQVTGGSTSSSVTATPGAARTPTSTAPSAATNPASVPLTLAITCASGSLHSTGKVCAHTLPSATLSITVRYCDGTYAKGLHSAAVADASGNYTWSWPVRMACVGSATATVTAKLNGAAITATQSFNVAA